MKVEIKVEQKIVDGKVMPKKYTVHVEIPYGTGGILWKKDMWLHDVDAETIKELIPLLTKELENALKY